MVVVGVHALFTSLDLKSETTKMIDKALACTSVLKHIKKNLTTLIDFQSGSCSSNQEHITRIWIDLNQKSFFIKTSEESSSFGLNVLLFVTTANSTTYILRNGFSVRGYKVVDTQTEVLNITSVIRLKDQINEQQENLMISAEANKVIDALLEDLIIRLRANELWNSRFVALSDKDILNETNIKWRWEKLQFNIIKRWIEKGNKRIIDAPSGSGRFSIALAREYPESNVLGIDLLPRALTLAEHGARLQNVANVNFQQVDILVLPEILRYDPKFDVVVSVGLAQNMTEDDLVVLVESFVRIVKPGGEVIISAPNGQGPIYRLWKLIVGKNLKYRFGLERSVSREEIIKLLQKQHLVEIEIEGTDPLYGLRKMYHVDPETGSAIPFWWSKYSRMLGQSLDYFFVDPLDWITKGWVSRQFGNDFIVKGKIPSRFENTPIGVRLISSDIETESLRDIVEDQFRAVRGQQSEKGEKLVFYDRLETKCDLEFPLSLRGELFKIRFFPQEPQELGERIIKDLPLLRFALSENINEIFDVYPRRKIYADKHLILCFSGDGDVRQSMYLDGLRAGFRFLKGMGVGYFGFFNAATPTKDSFHYQFFGDPNDQWPIWRNLEKSLLAIDGERLYGVDDVSVGNLTGWPITAPIFQSTDPESLANAIWEEINPERLSENTIPDLIFTHARDGRLKVILILRDKVESLENPKTFYPENIDSYGTFGCMELAGMILMKWDDQIYQSLKNNIELTAERVTRAFAETTLPFVV